jgi:Na+-transporting methylmalonyl-CoA/oxaloacetate decarboxylase gamma subunit
MKFGDETYSEVMDKAFGETVIWSRYSEGMGILYISLIIIILVIQSIRAFLGKIIAKSLRWFLKKCLRSRYANIAKFVEPTEEETEVVMSYDLLSDLRLGPLQDMYNRAKRDKREFLKSIGSA